MDNNSEIPSADIGGNTGGANVEGLPAIDADLSAELAQLETEAGAQSQEEVTAAAAIASTSEADYKELLTQLMGPVFAVMAPGWNVQAGEVDALAGAYSPLLTKYFPEGPGKFGPEVAAVLTTVMVFGPRLKMPRTLEAAPEKPQKTHGPAANDDVAVSLEEVA